MILGSMPCDKKISEPKVFRKLIEILNIKGAVVVADALHTTKKSAEKVVKEGGDYLFVVKDNNPGLKEEIELYVQNEHMDKCAKTEKNGGRIEKRTAYTSTALILIGLAEKMNGKVLSASVRSIRSSPKAAKPAASGTTLYQAGSYHLKNYSNTLVWSGQLKVCTGFWMFISKRIKQKSGI